MNQCRCLHDPFPTTNPFPEGLQPRATPQQGQTSDNNDLKQQEGDRFFKSYFLETCTCKQGMRTVCFPDTTSSAFTNSPLLLCLKSSTEAGGKVMGA